MTEKTTLEQSELLTPSSTFDVKYIGILPHTPEGGQPQPYDLTPLFLEMNFFQDLSFDKKSSPLLTASILIREGLDILDTLPILGGEEVRVSFKSPAADEYTELGFRVSRIGLVGEAEDNSSKKAFWLHLVTVDAYKDSMMRVSLGLEGTYSEMAKILFEQLESTVKFEDIDESSVVLESFATPLWPVLKTIDYMAGRSFDDLFMPFVFYQDFNGYHYKSLTTIFQGGLEKRTAEEQAEFDKKNQFFQGPSGAVLLNENQFDSERFLRTIKKCEKKLLRDQYVANYQDILAVNEIVYDMRTKDLYPTQRVYSEWFNETPHLDSHPLFADEFDRQNVKFLKAQPDGSEQIDYARRVINYSLASTSMRLCLTGDNRLNVGQVYYIEDVSNRPKDNVNITEVSKLTTGHYLIVKLRHKISRITNTYDCIAEVCKDSFMDKVLPNVNNQSKPVDIPEPKVERTQSQEV